MYIYTCKHIYIYIQVYIYNYLDVYIYIYIYYSIAPRTPPGQERGVTKSLKPIESFSLKRLQKQKVGRKLNKSLYLGVLEAKNHLDIEL